MGGSGGRAAAITADACLTPDDDCDRRRTCTTRKKLLAVQTKLDELLAGIGLDELV